MLVNKIINHAELTLVVLVTLSFFSCTQKKITKPVHYNVDSVMLAQRNYLTENKARLVKKIVLQGKTDSVSINRQDAKAWDSELDIFRSLEIINKPINRNAYSVQDTTDTKSNLRVRLFTSKKDLSVKRKKNLSIKYLRIYYHDSLSKLRKIEALYQEENALYKSSRTIGMEFLEISNKNVLTSYSVHGGQKMFLGDSVEFSILGKITIN